MERLLPKKEIWQHHILDHLDRVERQVMNLRTIAQYKSEISYLK